MNVAKLGANDSESSEYDPSFENGSDFFRKARSRSGRLEGTIGGLGLEA
jgi:hypothetical protein